MNAKESKSINELLKKSVAGGNFKVKITDKNTNF